MATKTMAGMVERVVIEKGFGFIKGADGGSYFFHRSELVAPLAFTGQLQGAKVVFMPQQSDKGPRAQSVAQG